MSGSNNSHHPVPLPVNVDNDGNNKYCISFADVRAAATRIEGVAHRTPVVTSASFDKFAGSTRHRDPDGDRTRPRHNVYF